MFRVADDTRSTLSAQTNRSCIVEKNCRFLMSANIDFAISLITTT